MNNDLFRTGMRKLAGAVNIITTTDDKGRRCGITATAVCSLSVEPPALVACVNRETSVGTVAPKSRIFCVNVLGHEQQHIADTFAGRTGLARDERFSCGVWQTLSTGAPALEGARVSFDCELIEVSEFSTHMILIGRVVHTRLGRTETPPLVYGDGAYLAALDPQEHGAAG